DESFLRDVAAACAREGEDGSTEKSEAEADPVRTAAVGVHADDNGDGGAKSGDLREGEIHEDDAALDDVHAEIGVNSGENEARDEGREKKGKNLHATVSCTLFRS